MANKNIVNESNPDSLRFVISEIDKLLREKNFFIIDQMQFDYDYKINKEVRGTIRKLFGVDAMKKSKIGKSICDLDNKKKQFMCIMRAEDKLPRSIDIMKSKDNFIEKLRCIKKEYEEKFIEFLNELRMECKRELINLLNKLKKECEGELEKIVHLD